MSGRQGTARRQHVFAPSIQRDLHLLEGYRHKVVDIDSARHELGLGVWWHELADEVWADGELCRE